MNEPHSYLDSNKGNIHKIHSAKISTKTFHRSTQINFRLNEWGRYTHTHTHTYIYSSLSLSSFKMATVWPTIT